MRKDGNDFKRAAAAAAACGGTGATWPCNGRAAQFVRGGVVSQILSPPGHHTFFLPATTSTTTPPSLLVLILYQLFMFGSLQHKQRLIKKTQNSYSWISLSRVASEVGSIMTKETEPPTCLSWARATIATQSHEQKSRNFDNTSNLEQDLFSQAQEKSFKYSTCLHLSHYILN